MRRQKTSVKIHGQFGDIVSVNQSEWTGYKRNESRDGDCVVPIRPGHKLSRKERVIRISKTLNDDDLLETLIHEPLHAMFPEKNEEWISDTARDLKNILIKFGFKRTEET